jgi:hypothetical protein
LSAASGGRPGEAGDHPYNAIDTIIFTDTLQWRPAMAKIKLGLQLLPSSSGTRVRLMEPAMVDRPNNPGIIFAMALEGEARLWAGDT